MSYRETAVEVVAGAEAALRGVISQALSSQAYRDVAVIAGVADRLACLARDLVESGSVGEGTVPVPQSQSAASVVSGDVMRPNAAVTRRPRQFPYFVRDGERLIKWAWSKKERKPYEHRAPREIVGVLLEAIRTGKGEGKLFEMSDLMPLKMASGEDYPSYQVYVVLAWLRTVDVIRKRGRAGYLLVKGTAVAKIDGLWNALPAAEEHQGQESSGLA